MTLVRATDALRGGRWSGGAYPSVHRLQVAVGVVLERWFWWLREDRGATRGIFETQSAEKGAVMNRRIFISKTAAATAGLALAFPKRGRAQASPNDTVNVAIIGIRGDNTGHP